MLFKRYSDLEKLKTKLIHERAVQDRPRLLISHADSLIWPPHQLFTHEVFDVNDVYWIQYISSVALTSITSCPSHTQA